MRCVVCDCCSNSGHDGLIESVCRWLILDAMKFESVELDLHNAEFPDVVLLAGRFERNLDSTTSMPMKTNNGVGEYMTRKRSASFWNRISQRRSSSKETGGGSLTRGEQLGIQKLLHLCQDEHCQKRNQVEGSRRKQSKSSPKAEFGSFLGNGFLTIGTKASSDRTNWKVAEGDTKFNTVKESDRESDETGVETRNTTNVQSQIADKKNVPATNAGGEKTSTLVPALKRSSIKADMRSQSVSQASGGTHRTQHHSTTRRHQQQQHFHSYSSIPLFQSLANADPRRSQHPATTSAAVVGFFGLIPPAPSILPSVAAASGAASWSKRRGNAGVVASRTFTSFDYALGVAGVDLASITSSNCALSSSDRDHFVVEFCFESFPNANENGRRSSAPGTQLTKPKRKSSAPTPRTFAHSNGDRKSSDSCSENGVHQARKETSTPPTSPISTSPTEDDTPQRSQQQQHERLDVVLAIRGVLLRDAVQGIVEKRGLSVDNVNLFLESSNTPLPWETDTSFLGGHKLFARAKSDNSPFSKNPLFVSKTSSMTEGSNNGVFSTQSQHAGGTWTSDVSGVSNCARKESTTTMTSSTPALAKYDRKLSLTQLTKKKVPDRLTLIPDTSLALNGGTVSNDGMLMEKSSGGSSHNQPPSDSSMVASSTETKMDNAPSSSSTPQHHQNGIVPDSASTGSASSIIGRKERSRSQGRLSQIFPNPFKPDDRLEMLERLAHFQEHGLMTAAGLLQDVNVILCQNALHLEEHWQDLTKNVESLTRKQQEQQEGLWELVTTELNYIKKLGCIVELQACVSALQTEGFLQDVDVESIFGNITDICRANLRFWLQCLYPLLQYSRQTEEPLDPTKLEAGFQHIDRLFYPYIPYCLNHVEMLCYIRRKQKESELFREFMMWVQSRRVFGRLHLTDLLAKPMQRLTKYPLLLKAVRKSTTDEPGRAALLNVIEKAEDFASRVNIELRHKQHYDALCNIMQCIESYDAIETTNDELDRLVKEYSYVDLTGSMLGCRPRLLRQLVLRGDLKLREGYSKMDVVCFLFTDMFLICKSIGKKGDRMRVKVIRPPYHLDRVVVRQLRETAGFAFVFLNEFNLPAAACTFLTPNHEEACKWLEHFHMAKDEYQRMKLSDEVTVYKQVGRRSFDVSSLSSSTTTVNGSHKLPFVSDVGHAPRRSSGHLMAPVMTGGGLNKDGPQRRISMTAMDQKKHRNPSPAMDAINHRKSNSVDNSVVTSGIVSTFKFGSVDGLRSPATSELIKSASEDDPTLETVQVPDADGGSEQESMIRRLRANSVEMLKRLSPRLRTPSPCGRPLSRSGSPSVLSFRAPPNGEKTSTTLAPCHNASSMLNPGFSTPPTTPTSKQADENGRRLSGGHSPLLPRPISPFRKGKIPSPVFFKEGKHEQVADGNINTGPGNQCSSPSSSTVMFRRESTNDSIEEHDETPGASTTVVNTNGHHSQSATSRRLERRYHTADGIEQFKPRRPPHTGILKRFSWSTPVAAAAAAAGSGASAIPPKLDASLRKASATTVSSESFGSSSGVSSSSSQLYVSQSESELAVAECSGVGENGSKMGNNMTSLSGRRLLKWSAMPRIGHELVPECVDETEATGQYPPNVSTIVIGEITAPVEAEDEQVSITPESIQFTSNSTTSNDEQQCKVIPTIETQAPTPLATPVSTQPAQGHTFNGPTVQSAKQSALSKEEFLNLLLRGNLESSDV